jgi:hypothetical protein
MGFPSVRCGCPVESLPGNPSDPEEPLARCFAFERRQSLGAVEKTCVDRRFRQRKPDLERREVQAWFGLGDKGPQHRHRPPVTSGRLNEGQIHRIGDSLRERAGLIRCGQPFPGCKVCAIDVVKLEKAGGFDSPVERELWRVTGVRNTRLIDSPKAISFLSLIAVELSDEDLLT